MIIHKYLVTGPSFINKMSVSVCVRNLSHYSLCVIQLLNNCDAKRPRCFDGEQSSAKFSLTCEDLLIKLFKHPREEGVQVAVFIT